VRAIEDASCTELVRALALIAAILLDPDAVAGRSDAPPQAPSDATEPSARAPPAQVSGEPEARFQPRAGAQLAVSSGASPGLAVGERWLAAIVRTAPGEASLELRASLSRARSNSDATGGPPVAFRLDTLRLEGCRSALSGEAAELWLCAAADGGVLGATGPARSRAVAWVALGALARGAFTLHGPLAAELELGATMPLSRYRFRLAGRTLHESAVVGATGGAGLAVRFP